MSKPKYKVGQLITAKIHGERIEGVIDQVDEHKGEIIYDLKDKERYVYEYQIISAR